MPTVIFASLATVGVHVTGTYVTLFVLYFLMNVFDVIVGVMASKTRGGFNSKVFRAGIRMKVGHWAVIVLAFIVHVFLLNIGKIINVDLSVTQFLGWFVLSAFAFTEIRSIFANLKILGVAVPPVFDKILFLAEKNIESVADGTLVVDSSDPSKDVYTLKVDTPLEELPKKGSVTFKVDQTHFNPSNKSSI